MSVALLPPSQAELVEAIARRVVELLDEREQPAAPRLLDAAAVAGLLGVSRSTVYEHADELGALRLGDGPRAPVRFDPARALAAWTAREESDRSQLQHAPRSTPNRQSARRRHRGAARSQPLLLPYEPTT